MAEIDQLLREQRITLADLAREQGIAAATTWRWSLRGIRNVRLETFSLGSRRFTTREAFARFIAATTAAANGWATAPPSRSNRRAEASASAAARELEEAGA